MKKFLSTLIVILIAVSAFAQTDDKTKCLVGMSLANSIDEYFAFTIDTSKAYSNMQIIQTHNMDSIEQAINGIIYVNHVVKEINYSYGIIVHTGMDSHSMYNNLRSITYNKSGVNSIETSDGYKVTIKESDRTYIILIKNNRFKMILHSKSPIVGVDVVLINVTLDKLYFSNYILKMCKTHDSSFDF